MTASLVPVLDAASEDDFRLMQRAAAGAVSAFEILMRRHNRRLYRVARAMLRDDAEAEDALQEAYIAAHGALNAYRGEASPVTWLSRLVTHECLDRLRKHTRRNNLFPITSIDGLPEGDVNMEAASNTDRPDAMLVRSQMRSMLERKLDDLPDAFRCVFVMRAVEELSVEETATALGIPEATVRTRHHRARGLLRESLAQEIDLAERDLYDFGGRHCDRVVSRVLSHLPHQADARCD